MKKIIYSILCIVVLQICMVSCGEDDAQLGAPPVATDATFTYSPSAANKNIINFTSTTEAFLKKWDFGNGAFAEGDNVKGTFATKGSYQVKLTAYTSGGSITSSQIIEIAETDPTLLNIPFYNLLTGGVSKTEGKTWVVDKNSKGHLGVGPTAGTIPEWYSAGPNEKDGKNLYDDEMTFKLADFEFDYDAHGTIYVNAAFSTVFPGTVSEGNGPDYFAPYPTQKLKWSANEISTDKWELTINGGFLGYYSGGSTYEVLAIDENELYVRSVQGGVPGNVWYQKFIPKDYVPPVVTPPYKITDLNQNFDDPGNVNFIGNSSGSITTYDNPAPKPINISKKVGMYIKPTGGSGEYANIQATSNFKFDLRDRHVFRLKAYLPDYNDYTTTYQNEPWQSYNTLQKQVSIKLQNSALGGDAYKTQVEVIQGNLETEKWIELTFDFSSAASRTDLDTIVLQIGGEGTYADGIFFFDDFELLP